MASKKTIPVALIDISSGQIAVAHALIQKGGALQARPIIVAEQVFAIPLQEEITIDRFIEDTKKLLQKALEQLQKSDVHYPEFILVTLAAPWVISQTRQIQYKKTTPFVCTKKLVDELLEKEIEYVETHDMERFGAFGKDGKLIEKQISHIALNGYQTSEPFGKKTLDLVVTLTVTVAPKPILDGFLDVLRRFYGTRNIGFASRLFSSYVFLRDFYQVSKDAWIIDFGNEITDVGFIKNGFMVSHHTFPTGSSHLYKTVAEKNNLTPEEAKALVETYRLGKASPEREAVLQSAISTFVSSWLQGLHTIFDSGQFGYCAPNSCFIIGDEQFAKIIPEAIVQDPFIQHFCSTILATPTFLTPEQIKQELSFQSESNEATLLVDSLFAERIL